MKKRFTRAAVIAAPFILIVTGLLFSTQIHEVAQHFPPCLSRQFFSVWCPACGNTRAVLALLRLDLLGSLRYNITPFVLLVVVGVFWMELIFFTFGKKIKLYPRKPLFSYLLVACMLVYYVLRNFIPFLLPV